MELDRPFKERVIDTTVSITKILLDMQSFIPPDRSDIKEWSVKELCGFSKEDKLPSYRNIEGGMLLIQHPVLGWKSIGPVLRLIQCKDGVSVLEKFTTESPQSGWIGIPIVEKVELTGVGGLNYKNWPQIVSIEPFQLQKLITGIRLELIKLLPSLEGVSQTQPVFVNKVMVSHCNLQIQNANVIQVGDRNKTILK